MHIAEILAGVGLGRMPRGQPLALAPVGSVPVAPGVELLEVEAGGVVFVWGRATWCFDAGDVVGRRLAAVQLVETGAARHGEVANAFGVTPVTLRSWRRAYATGRTEALAPAKPGPKGASKLTEEKREEIERARAAGASMDDVAAKVGLSRNSVSRALAAGSASAGAHKPGASPAAVARRSTSTALVPASSTALVPLARPAPRPTERQAARSGALVGAAPVICEGASLPLAGALVILPALSATGLLDCAAELYEAAKPAFYGLASLVL